LSEAPEASLLSKTAGGAGWVVGFRMVTRLLGIVSTLTLARLLGPGDFGLVALASGFAQTVDAVTNLSVHEAIIRERAPERSMYDTAFTMSLIRGLVTAAVVAAAASPVAGFFHEPRLAVVLLALAGSNLIGAVENIATADFMRTFAFHKEFQLWTIPRVLQVIVTISFALIWPTYWALVAGIVTGRVARTVLSYTMYPYLPRITLSAWRRIAGFTAWSWVTYMIVILRDRIDTLLIGRLFSAGQVGIYALGGEIASLPTTELIEPLCRACFPGFSQLRHDGLSVGQTFVRLLGAAAMLVLPAGAGIAAVADPLVKLAFGTRWLEAIPMIQILGVTATLGLIGSLSGTLFSAYAMLRTTMIITAVTTALRAALLLAFLPGGTLTTAAAVVAVVVSIEQSAYLVIAMRRFHVRTLDLVRAVYRSFVATLAMTGCLLWLGLGFTPVDDGFALRLVVAVAAGASIYAAVLAGAWVAAGRPDGAERDLLAIVNRLGGYLGARLATALRR
jgi:O-antigen/teichoic acid export membrane protein